MSPYIQQFINDISPNICWELYPEYIEGFTEHQIDIYAEALDIEINGTFRQWLLTFGKCSGGLFTINDFNLYWHVNHAISVLKQHSVNKEWQMEIYEEGLISEAQYALKPYSLYRENEIDFYFVLTKDPELFVWFYTDSDDKPAINTGLTFNDFLKLKLSKLECAKGIWFEKNEVIEMSSSNVFK